MSKTILIIDDTINILNIVKYFLTNEGYKVKTASDPLVGIEVAKTSQIDLLILDIMMPKMNGYQVYEILKQDEKTKYIPVIMLTAKAVIDTTPRSFFYGLYGFLSKPFTREKLVGMVKDILDLTGERK